jgi:dTDP-4-amino-4,6-dideoxygalactose transaminase
MQFRDLGAQYKALKPEIDAGIQAVIDSNAFILGKPVTELENKLAEYVGRKHCVACANGTDALQLALMIFGVGAGDAVFTSDFTYFASAGSASILGATPILVDIDPQTFNMSPEALERAIESVIKEGKLTPKVIIPVDLFGQPADRRGQQE